MHASLPRRVIFDWDEASGRSHHVGYAPESDLIIASPRMARMGWGRDANEIERADIHHGQGLKGSLNRPDTEAQDQLLQIITFGLQRAAGPYKRASAAR